MRINKYLASSGIASRRKVEEFILEGKVKVNGEIITQLGYDVKENDKVEFEGKVVKPEEEMVYLLLNKPIRVITSSKDQFDRKSVLDLIDVPQRIYPVGRLDYDSCGLILLTNDGDLANKLTHPRNHIEKKYVVFVKGQFSPEDKYKFENGLEIDGYITQKCKLTIASYDEETNKTRLIVSLYEGRNRQIRKMMEALGYDVTRLQRVAIGKIFDNSLKFGDYRELTNEELKYLRSL